MEKTCVVEGCGQPRMVNKKGKTETRCHKHQKEYWRENARKQAAKKGQRPIQDNRVDVPETTRIVVEQIKAAKTVVEQPKAECETCSSCTYREVVSMLRVKYPKIDDLVEALQKAREIRDELGI